MDENYLKELDALRELYSKESELNTEKVVKLTPEDIEEKKSMQLRIYEQGRKQYHLEKSNRSATYKIPEIAEVMDDEMFNKLHRDSIAIQFKKPWTKLNAILKIDRINKYLRELKKEHNISKNNFNAITMRMRELVNEKILTKKKAVEYNEEDGIIENIPNLVYNDNKLEYIIEPPKPKKEQSEEAKMKKKLKELNKNETSKEFATLRNRSKRIRNEMLNKHDSIENNDIKN